MWTKNGRAGQVTGDNIIRSMRFACWITKSTDVHSEYVILIACACYDMIYLLTAIW